MAAEAASQFTTGADPDAAGSRRSRATWAPNARAALDLLEEDASGFDVMFSDVVMPGMNGIELGKEIRRRWPDLPVVLTSGYSHVLANGGARGFELLHKPYSAESVSRVLRSSR
ncbi:response regulator [Belnapia rosea]|uniref:response regulator n=1 Tax=Belnapia rosea TaxID=938405 RepID=UPI001FE0C5D7|nr:response regulator [Belnapia rosea]